MAVRRRWNCCTELQRSATRRAGTVAAGVDGGVDVRESRCARGAVQVHGVRHDVPRPDAAQPPDRPPGREAAGPGAARRLRKVQGLGAGGHREVWPPGRAPPGSCREGVRCDRCLRTTTWCSFNGVRGIWRRSFARARSGMGMWHPVASGAYARGLL